MNDTVFWRLVWKEYRFQRGFWISLAAMTFLGQLIALNLPVASWGHLTGVYGLALIMPVFYALGSGATLFASEHEEGTAERLRILAASQGQVLLSKVAFATTSTVALVALLALMAWLVSRGELPEPDFHESLALWGAGLAEALAWGTLFSMVCRKVIHAVILAAAVWVVSLITLDWHYTTPGSMLFQDGVAAPVLVRLAVAGGVMLLAIAISRRWDRPQMWSLPSFVGIGADRTVPLDHPVHENSRIPRLRRLLWQEWRQAWKTVAVLSLAIYGVLGMVVALMAARVLRGDAVGGWFVFGLLVLPTLLGSRVFSAEQEGFRFRFLANRGCSPSLVWFSKHAVWLMACFLTSWLVCGFVLAYLAISSPAGATAEGWFLLLPPLNYCAGQLISMLARRGLYTLFLSLVFAAVLDGWVLLMNGLGVSPLISIAPLPFILLIATWARANDWMLERKNWAARLRLLATLGVPAFAILSGVVAYRVYEIPKVQVAFSLTEYLPPITEDETATADLYRKAGRALVSMVTRVTADGRQPEPNNAQHGWELATEVEKEWLQANHEVLQLTLQAARRDSCVLQDPATREPYTTPSGLLEMRELAYLLLLDARRLEFEGKLSEAKARYWSILRMARHAAQQGEMFQYLMGRSLQLLVYERIPRWAAHPKQTTSEVVQAIRELHGFAARQPSINESVKTEHVMLRRLHDENPVHSPGIQSLRSVEVGIGRFWHLIPWERARGLRLVNLLVARVSDRLELVEKEVKEGKTYRDFVSSNGQLGLLNPGSQTRQWMDTTLDVGSTLLSSERMETLLVDELAARRACVLRMAIVDFLREHGVFPQKLGELEGTYFPQLPLDPFSGEEFEYRPQGLPEPVEFWKTSQFKTQPDRPLLWSVGPNYTPFTLLSDGQTIVGYWAFPIPVIGNDGPKSSP